MTDRTCKNCGKAMESWNVGEWCSIRCIHEHNRKKAQEKKA